jgi:hypothetical protein
MKNFICVLTTICLLILTGCSHPCPQQSLAGIKYDYIGKLGIYGIASDATAVSPSEEIIAKAHAIKIVESSDGGPGHLLVEEEYYDKDGKIIYKGNLEFKFGFEYASLILEKPVSGKKCLSAFTSWPCGR